jgi:predicted lipid-binding transport protein (Tim44 family)
VSYDGTDPVKRLQAQAATHLAVRPFLAKCLVGVRAAVDGGRLDVDNLTSSSPEMTAVLDALDAAGLLGAVFTCARDFQDLSVPQREVYGSRHPSISRNSTADAARPPADEPLAVTVGPSASTSLTTPLDAQTVAPAVTSSTSPGLGAPSISIAPAGAPTA